MRSLVIPVVADFINDHPSVRTEVLSREIRELLPLLSSNALDFIVTTEKSQKQELECQELGVEENVLVRARSGKFRENVYLDHDAEDMTTFAFLKLQGKTSREIERSYLDEVYAIVDGVAMGLGQAVLPKHIVQQDRRLKIVPGLKPLKIPFLPAILPVAVLF